MSVCLASEDLRLLTICLLVANDSIRFRVDVAQQYQIWSGFHVLYSACEDILRGGRCIAVKCLLFESVSVGVGHYPRHLLALESKAGLD